MIFRHFIRLSIIKIINAINGAKIQMITGNALTQNGIIFLPQYF